MYLTKEKYLSIIESLKSNYWNEGKDYRWEYMSIVINELKKLNINIICEAGSSRIPLNSNSILIGLKEDELVNEKGIIHNLDNFPYPFKNKEIDCFVALQVWEHLENQLKSFKEIQRISKYAILSFPYKWTYGDSKHRGIDENIIAKWSDNLTPYKIIHQVKNRIIYIWKF